MRTLFYFNDVSQIKNYYDLIVEPVSEGFTKSWLVVGVFNIDNQEEKFPVAEFPLEPHAKLFVSLCKPHLGARDA
ncbi:MAG: hypothetical protein ACK4S8_08700 [Alishewanella aestuarii]